MFCCKKNMEKIECFKIALLQSNENEINKLDFSNSSIVYSIECARVEKAHATYILADPFLLALGDSIFMFYEHKELFKPGVIKMISSTNLKDWSIPITVLEEKVHLSFPNTFLYNGAVYMIPETSSMGEIRLYKAKDCSLTCFQFVKTLLKEEITGDTVFSFSDTDIRYIGGKYFLFTTVNNGKGNELHLYYSDDFFGDYVEHPKSPICIDQRYARNGGAIMEMDGQLYRIAQDCSQGYGDNINILKILDISVEDYKEELVKNNVFPRSGFYKYGGHQFNCVKYLDGSFLIATDAKEYHYFFLRRLIHKFRTITNRLSIRKE